MKYLYLIDEGNQTTFDDIDMAVQTFVEKYETKPDLISVHHKSLNEIYRLSCQNQHGVLTYLDNGDILILTYLGKIKLSPTLTASEKMIISNNQDYILVENKEAQKADKILLGEDENENM